MTTTELPQGDVQLLETEIARGLLASAIPARLAFVAKDGTPRVTPINFYWNGTEVVMAGFAPSLKVKALRANPSVALTIDWETLAELALGKGLPADLLEQRMAQLRELRPRMERITVRPEWVGVMDFQQRYPTTAPDWMRS